MFNVFIYSNNLSMLSKVYNAIKLKTQYNVAGFLNSYEQDIDALKSAKILIFDSTLSVKDLNFLNKIAKINSNLKVILITDKADKSIELNNKLNVYQIFTIPFNEDEFIDAINSINNINIKIHNRLSIILSDFCFNKASVGYNYIIECLQYCIINNLTHIDNMKNLYRIIEEKYNNKEISQEKISWNIAKAIDSMNKSTDSMILNKFFHYVTYPSSKIFLNELLHVYYSDT